MTDHLVADRRASRGASVRDVVEVRSQRLATGLAEMGVAKGDVLAVLCCDAHALDQRVAQYAGERLDCTTVVLPQMADGTLKETLTDLRPVFLLACPDGTVAWRRTRVPCRVIGDEGAMVWWKAFELRSPGDLPDQLPGAVAN